MTEETEQVEEIRQRRIRRDLWVAHIRKVRRRRPLVSTLLLRGWSHR